MATPRNPLESFIWGSGGRAMTPEQVAREREIAAALTDQGADFSPVGHWLQGAARLGHSAAGAFRDWRASEGERAGREGFSDRWSSVFGGGESPVAEALSDGVSSPALDAANSAGLGVTPLPEGADWLRYANQGATRSLPLNEQLVSALSFLPELGVEMEVFSGGQPEAGGGPRVGSTRHDHGNAADVFFYRDGQQLDWANPEHLPIYEEIVRRGRAAGITGFGAGEGYMRPGSMHIGFGPESVWGAGGSGANAPEWLRSAYNSPTGGGAASPQPVQVASLDPSIGMPDTQSPINEIGSLESGPGVPSGLPPSAAPGTVAQGPDGRTYMYAETSGMAGATGSQGWIPYSGGAQASQAGVTPSIAELLALSGDPNFGYASPAQQQIVQALMGQQLQQQDPRYQQQLRQGDLDYQRGTWEFDQLRNAPPPLPDAPKVQEFYDDQGQPYMAQWNAQIGEWEQVGGAKATGPTPLQQEYDSYVNQELAAGREPLSQFEFDLERRGRGATNISNVVGGETGPKLGSLSTDYGYVLDPETKEPVIDSETGLATAAPVPGSPAAREIEAAQAQAESREAQAATQAGTVTQDAGIALQGLGELGGLSADNGPAGANWRRLQSGIAGTPEHRIQTFVNSALANVGFDQLNQMRQNSPTGGALGNVTELQLRQLESVLGQYDIGLPIEDQQFILQRISNVYSDIVFGSRAERDRAVREGKLTPEQADRYDQYYYPETRDAMGRPIDQGAPQQPNQSQANPDILPAPDGVPADLWGVMTPEERALWQ